MASERAAIASAQAALADDAEALQSRLEDGLAAASQADQARLLAEQRLEDLTGIAAELRLQLTRATTLLDAAEARANRLQGELTAHVQQLQIREIDFSEERRLQAEHLRGVENRAHTEIDRARQESRKLKKLVDAGLRAKQAADEGYREREETLRRQLADAQRDAAVARAEANTLLAARKLETAGRGKKKSKAPTTAKRASHNVYYVKSRKCLCAALALLLRKAIRCHLAVEDGQYPVKHVATALTVAKLQFHLVNQ
ncbi:hypothetical protein L2Y94_11040 [Luteibacter aegosomatis]|uniref:hypothetical protein n=1 Tax=Luteibacter aegosomatis TaxID=2911537 RepID=UPI001FFC2203|nr:hypothetical protein [Luteibacter aegosomatis]UPG83893.1 hypothetical protein L2Y94_11040 [Luteibacter aegosomatis]